MSIVNLLLFFKEIDVDGQRSLALYYNSVKG